MRAHFILGLLDSNKAAWKIQHRDIVCTTHCQSKTESKKKLRGQVGGLMKKKKIAGQTLQAGLSLKNTEMEPDVHCLRISL